MFDSIREAYSVMGVEGYYRKGGYLNHHLAQVQRLVSQIPEWFQPCRVLDVGCGNGEVTSLLSDLGFKCEGLDPFMAEQYRCKTGCPCTETDFQGMMALDWSHIDLVVGSYSLHLCDESLLVNLANHLPTPWVILGPHKYPDLRPYRELIGERRAYTERGRSVRMRAFAPASWYDV